MNDIVQRTGIERGPASKYLSVLQDLRLIEREIPVTEKYPEKSRKGIYRLSDNFFRFWFRFVLPVSAAATLARSRVVRWLRSLRMLLLRFRKAQPQVS
jgi:AAA+ ATPase superfamily predicted ATPase